MARGLRIGYPDPGARVLTLESGSYALNGQNVALSTSQSGDFVHGQEFVLSGSGFGTRGDYGGSEDRLNWKNLTFASGIEEEGFTVNSGLDTHWVHMTTGGRHARSPNWVKRWNNGNIQYLQIQASMPTTTFFFSSWQKWNNANGKTWRIWHSAAAGGDPRPDLWANYGTGSIAVDSPLAIQFVDGGAVEPPENEWFRLDVLMREGGSGMLVDIWITGQNGNNAIYTKDYAGAGFDGAINPSLGAGEDNESESQYWGFQHVYYDFTAARVELADTNTWAARTKSEIQLEKARSDTEITIVANAGSFTSGQTAYLYVVKEDRSVVGPVQSVVIA